MNLHDLDLVFSLTCHTSMQACVLIIAVLVVQAMAGKRLPARFRYALSFLVLLRLILLVTPVCNWSVFNLTRQIQPSPGVAPILPSAAFSGVSVPLPSNQPPAAVSEPSRPSLGRLAAVFWLCGSTLFLLAVLWRHRTFSRWVAQLPTATDPRLLALVEQCKREAGVRRAVRFTLAPQENSAAVFGFYRPCLLLPDGMLDTLERREARLVLLHEFVHIRRHDVLVNWFSVLALALHWFNPLAWVAMRRLRADQELACDAVVLGLIEHTERGDYGRTLLKHLHDFPAARMAVGLVPLITSRNNIKKRIIMITEFKRTGGLARGLFAVLLVALGGLTFTRAADEPEPAAISRIPPPSATTETPLPHISTVTPSPKTGRDYGAEYVNQSTLLEQLNRLDSDDHKLFIQALSVTTPDPLLNSLLEQEMAQETKLASLKSSDPDLELHEREGHSILNDIEQKIDRRAKGIMAGMALQVTALKAAGSDAAGRLQMLTARLEDWDHKRVMVASDYLEYSNVLFHLTNLPGDKLGGALATAYAHQLDPELTDLSASLQAAKAKMVEASNNYGQEMPIFKTAKKQLEDAQTAYQNKIDAVMAGIRTRVSEDDGYLQIIQKMEDEIQKDKKDIMEAQKNRN
jgi:beta-lactamase regulating signal transducer with metallopeptidase domain